MNWRKIEKKRFKSKLLELWKSGTKKWSPDMFNFYVVLADHDKVTDDRRPTTCRCNFKAPPLLTKSTRNEGHFGNIGFHGKIIWRFQSKKGTKTIFTIFQKRPMKHTTSKCNKVSKVFWQICANYMIISLGTKRLLKTQIFEKKNNPSDD